VKRIVYVFAVPFLLVGIGLALTVGAIVLGFKLIYQDMESFAEEPK
jgi:hypothetical protein